MAGRCGTRRCKVLGGEVLDHGSEEQRPLDGDGSYVLACQTYITEPCTIEIPEPDEVIVHPARIVKATLVHMEYLTHDIKRLVLEPNKPIEFSPGQYVQLQFSPGHARPYSMSGLSTDQQLEFHVRLIPDGRVSTYISRVLKVGDTVRLSGPLGSAYLRRKHAGPMLCVAAATGLAPVLDHSGRNRRRNAERDPPLLRSPLSAGHLWNRLAGITQRAVLQVEGACCRRLGR